MGDLHNPRRYGELWPQHRIDACLLELEALREQVVISGGWAWHFLSPAGHPEYKHAHDHKDIDLMVPKRAVAEVMGILLGRGFERVWTRYDRLPSDEEFRRYEKVIEPDQEKPFRITIDFFVRDVAYRTVRGGWRVVEPEVLLSFYSTFHSSKACIAVQAAHRLLEQGEDPEDRAELCTLPER